MQIAAIFEFVGAMALGGEVAKTVAGSVTDPQNFKDVPEVFAYVSFHLGGVAQAAKCMWPLDLMTAQDRTVTMRSFDSPCAGHVVCTNCSMVLGHPGYLPGACRVHHPLHQ